MGGSTGGGWTRGDGGGAGGGSGARPGGGSEASAGGGSGASAFVSSGSAVDRNRAESGPSRMLARLPRSIPQHLLSQPPVGVCRLAVGVVLEHRHSLHRRLGKTNCLRDARGEDPVSKVLFEDLDRLLGVDRPRVD